MKRRALIIGSPLHQGQRDFLPGVIEDVRNMYRLQYSSTGGAWEKVEMKVLMNPAWAEVRDGINIFCRNADIAFVYFSGHGCMFGGYDHIKINNRDVIDICELYAEATRQIIILDSCRTPCPYPPTPQIGDIGFLFDYNYRHLAKRLYNEAIAQAPDGKAILFSTEPETPSFDTEDGGNYTLSLIGSILDWHRSNKSALLSLHQAFEASRIKLVRSNEGQFPMMHCLDDAEAHRIPVGVNSTFIANEMREAEVSRIRRQGTMSLGESIAFLASIGFTAYAIDRIIKKL